ncbi:MAG: hypothetical protein Q7S06_00985 [Nanoarchaeota archaeon]|nr:hypothetical protein [Nanoarchaeota archaeon]
MAVFRNHYLCEGCGCSILFKYQFENEEEVPVRFNCPKCSIPISGKIICMDKTTIWKLENVKEGDKATGIDFDFTVLHSSCFPTAIISGFEALTPMFYFFRKTGANPNSLLEIGQNSSLFDVLRKELKKIIYYLYSGEEQKVLELLKKEGINISEKRVIEVVSRLIELPFLSIIDKDEYINLRKDQLNLKIEDLPDNFFVSNHEKILSLFKEFLEFIGQIIDAYPSLRPCLSLLKKEEIKHMGFGYYAFNEKLLIKLYQDLFELNSKMLELYMKIIGEEGKIKEKDTHGKKINFLDSKGLHYIQKNLDFDLRNGIGHKNIQFDFKEQEISYKTKKGTTVLSFHKFFIKIIRNITQFMANLKLLANLIVIEDLKNIKNNSGSH